MLRQKCPDLIITDAVWRKRWILHVTAWGNGEQAVLDYLARYVFRVALTNARIVGLDDQTVTIQYKERKTGLGAEEGKSSGRVELDQPGEEQAAEEHAQHPHRQEEGWTRRYPAPPVE